jgi:hypothetical protein
MIFYESLPNIGGTFPNTIGINSTGPGINDGTPYLAAVINDLWGANQALLNAAFQIPNGSDEADGASQRLDAMKRILGHPGEVIAWMGANDDPSTEQIRLLPLNGQGVPVATFFELDAACWVGVPDNPTASAFYRADNPNGSPRNAAGAYLILPDMRGFAIRGLDPSGTTDPDGASRDIGSLQDESVNNHYHEINVIPGPYPVHEELLTTGTGSTTRYILQRNTTAGSQAFASTITVGNWSSETRMVNKAARWCIRY